MLCVGERLPAWFKHDVTPRAAAQRDVSDRLFATPFRGILCEHDTPAKAQVRGSQAQFGGLALGGWLRCGALRLDRASCHVSVACFFQPREQETGSAAGH